MPHRRDASGSAPSGPRPNNKGNPTGCPKQQPPNYRSPHGEQRAKLASVEPRGRAHRSQTRVILGPVPRISVVEASGHFHSSAASDASRRTPGESRDPGRTARLVPPSSCSRIPGQGSTRSLDADFRRHERRISALLSRRVQPNPRSAPHARKREPAPGAYGVCGAGTGAGASSGGPPTGRPSAGSRCAACDREMR